MSQTATQRLQWVTQRLDELGGQGIISLLKQKVQASTKYLKYVEELLTETPHSSDSNAGGDQPSPSRQPRKRETAPAKSIKQALTRSLSASSQIPDRYRLSAVFSDLELQKMFLRYLKKNFCEENLLFLLELEAFEKLPSDKLLRTIDQINLNYISRNSKKELNLNASTKKQFANALESLHSSFDEEVARTIFNQCKIEITALLETDSFHKFSKTKEFIAYRKFVEAETIPESMRKSANVATEDLNLEDHSVIDIRFILREPILKRSLYTFMKKSHCEENLEFVERVSVYENCPVTSLLKEADDIYNQFVKSNAPAEINIDAQTKKGIEQTIEKLKTEFEETDAREIFSEAKKYITGLIQMNSVHKFLTSTEYKDCRTTFDKIRGQAESETSQNLTLSESDWELINTGSIIRTFAQGESIILQGDTSTVVYFLVSGVVSCRCTRKNKRVDIPPLDTPGMIFGELGLFHSLPAYSSYVVQSEFVKVRELKVSFLLRLFEAHPALGVRIYNFIGQQLAGVITYEGLTDQLSQQPLSPQATHLAKQPRSTPRAIEEDNFAKTFPDIAQKETLIVSHQVSVPRSVVRSGTIYISQHYLSFTSMIFGQKSKELYPLFASTTTVQPVKDLDFLITAKSHKRKFRMKSRETRDVVLSLLESLLTIESEDTHKFAVSASESKSMELSEEEWKLILGSEAESCIQFVKGDYIMHKGLTYKTLFQTVSGAYNVEKVIAGSKTVLAQLEAGEVLGEINFFTHKAATASIVVTSPTAEVFLIHKERLWKELLVTHPKVVVRFYNHLCYILGLRLTKSQ